MAITPSLKASRRFVVISDMGAMSCQPSAKSRNHLRADHSRRSY
jgi:hypothetical protein